MHVPCLMLQVIKLALIKIDEHCYIQPPLQENWKNETMKSQIFLKTFLDYFINVRNYIKCEAFFRERSSMSEIILIHLLTFAWGILKDSKRMDNVLYVPTGVKIEDYLIIVMKMIRIFSRLDTVAAMIGQKHGMKLILRAMLDYPYCMQLQINCSACLANLASVEENRNQMLHVGCIQKVLDNMERFYDSPQVQAEVCATLANLACHEANAKYIVEKGGCILIIRAMRTHLNMLDFQIQAFHALASLGKLGKDILSQENFINVAIRCMNIHSEDVDLVSAAWHALGTLANSGFPFVDHKTYLIGLIFDSMRKFKSSHTFQITACFALAHVFFNNRM